MTSLADAEWHRVHPATPLLKGGIAFVAIIGIVIANLRERLIELVVGSSDYQGDPIDYLLEKGYLPIAGGALIGVLALAVLFFWVSWRMTSFRITDESVEMRSGVVFRSHRRARLDRIQGINVVRPVFARLFGTAKLEVQVAGDDGKVDLAYLRSAEADSLRAEILRLASGTQRAAAAETDADGATGPGGARAVLERRAHELLAPELDPSLPVTSVVDVHPLRLLGSTLLSGTTLWFLGMIAGFVVALVVTGEPWIIFTVIPIALGFVSYAGNRLLKFLRYSIAATPDGVRIGYGLLSTRNETLPPGRIHSIGIDQPLLWRPFGWWHLRVNRAARANPNSGNDQQQNATVLPVGTREEALRVLALLAPELVERSAELLESGFARGGDGDGYTTSPRRAAVLRWFSWRRNGFAITDGAVLLRRGAIWRELVIVPTARMQSVQLTQGPLLRSLRLAAVHAHTVTGPISSHLGALDRDDAERFFAEVAAAGVSAAAGDTSHRWGSGAVASPPSPNWQPPGAASPPPAAPPMPPTDPA